MESFTEIRCPACVPLGWQSSRLLLKIHGKVLPSANVTIQVKCHRCKSVVEWILGTPVLTVTNWGVKNNKKSSTAFE